MLLCNVLYDVFTSNIKTVWRKMEDKYYLPRDVSWMYFNRRILREAMKERVPILESVEL